jgi:uncharacterized membrane protein
MLPARPRLRAAVRVALAAGMIGIGVVHFVAPEPFVRIVPAWLPAPLVLVWVSGLCEILGGAGLLVPRTRSAAGIGLAALYVAVFPANVNMAIHHLTFDTLPEAALWARLPFQAALIALALWVRRDASPAAPAAPASPVSPTSPASEPCDPR